MKEKTVPKIIGLAILCIILNLIFSPSAAQATSELQVYITQAFKATLEKHVVPIMKDKYDVNVVMTPNLSSRTLAKAVAQKNKPTISVFMLDEGPWMQGKAAGLWAKLDPMLVPNLKQIPERLRDPDGMGTGYTLYMLGLLYDTAEFKKRNFKAPNSIYDLWNPAYKRYVTIPSAVSSFSYALLFRINALEGGTLANLDPGFKKLGELAENVGTIHGGASTLIPLFSQKQAWLGWSASFVAKRLAKAGVKIKFVPPKEGTMVIPAYAAMAKNAPLPEAAQHFINIVLSPEYQKIQAEMAFGGFVNPNTQLDPDFAKSFPLTKEAVEKGELMPWEFFNINRPKLTSRYQREVESK